MTGLFPVQLLPCPSALLLALLAAIAPPAFAARAGCANEGSNQVSQAVRLMERGPAFDPARARVLLETADRAGSPDANFNLGLLHMRGLGVDRSDIAASKFFKKAAECGHTPAQFNLAQILLDSPRSQAAAAQLFAAAASSGHSIAAYNLGLMYAKGLGVKTDTRNAGKYFKQAADAGNADAMYNLGHLYSDDSGNANDYQLAMQYYLKAARREHAGAQAQLAFHLVTGGGVKKDHKGAVYWLQRAAKNGDSRSIEILKSLAVGK